MPEAGLFRGSSRTSKEGLDKRFGRYRAAAKQWGNAQTADGHRVGELTEQNSDSIHVSSRLVGLT